MRSLQALVSAVVVSVVLWSPRSPAQQAAGPVHMVVTVEALHGSAVPDVSFYGRADYSLSAI